MQRRWFWQESETLEIENFKMFDISPVLPFHLLVLHLVASFLALCLCLPSFVAIYTKTTPYPTKLFSLGLLVYDCLFLVTANGCKVFTFEDSFVLRYFSRGFQVAGLIIVSCMPLERLFVLQWPYVCLRVATKRRIRKVCITVIIVSLLQYILIRALICNARGVVYGRRLPQGIYYAMGCVVLLGISIGSYVKIFRIIRNGSGKMTDLKLYKGTAASLLYLINSVSVGVYLS